MDDELSTTWFAQGEHLAETSADEGDPFDDAPAPRLRLRVGLLLTGGGLVTALIVGVARFIA